MASSPRTIAIFGATGGTGLATMKHSLAAGYIVNVLVRTPSKLEEVQKQYPSTLHIIQGNIHDPSTVKATLTVNNKIVDVIMSSIGMILRREGLCFTAEDPTLCEKGVKAILSALTELETQKGVSSPVGGPRIVAVSSTGISDRGRDLPLVFVPLYPLFAQIPHEDKKLMEDVLVKGEGKSRKWIIVRPSLMLGDVRGLEKVRVSTETPGLGKKEAKEEHAKTAIGYTITREDVGAWIFEECVKGDGEKWMRKMVTLTY